MREALEGGFLTATDMADYLVGKGVPFRKAHEVVGKMVRYAEREGKELRELSLEEFRSFAQEIDEDVYDYLSIELSLIHI